MEEEARQRRGGVWLSFGLSRRILEMALCVLHPVNFGVGRSLHIYPAEMK
jgi:hypothetical protein